MIFLKALSETSGNAFLLRWFIMDYKKINQLPIFFIVGIPRSGTTMLQQMLDANPAVITPLESRIIIVLKQKYFKKRSWTNENIDEFIEDLFAEPKFMKGWSVDRDHLTRAYRNIPLKDVKFDLLLKMVYYAYPSIYDKNEVKILGDKNPIYTIFIDEIKEIFPEAKFIHIIRDYRANIVSNRKWFPRKKIAILAQTWLIGNRVIDKQKRLSPHNFYTVRYEDLVADPEKYAREIAVFLDVDYHRTMVDFHRKTQELYVSKDKKVTNFHRELVKTIHENIIKPIHTGKIDTWKKELTPKEIAVADYICIQYAQQYRYEAMYAESGVRLRIKSLSARMRIIYDMFIIREYQGCPSWVKKLFRYTSIVLYKCFRISHIFNAELKPK